MIPQIPTVPCADMAPTGSSILNLESNVITEKYTMIPPINPINVARPPVGVSGAAVMATRPAIAPLIAMVTSAFPLNILLANRAPITPPAAAILVLRKT